MNGQSQTKPLRGATAVLKLLYDVTHEFSSTLDLPGVLGKVLSLTVQALGAERGSLFMLDEHGRVVKHILARKHLPPEVREQVVATVMGKGLAGWVYRHSKGAIIVDTEKDERWHTFAEDIVVRSVLSAPLVRRGTFNGIITLMHPTPGAFSRADFQLLTAIAHQAAVAIENARLFTQISGERDTIAALLNGVRDAILVVKGNQHRVTMVNPAAARLFGIQPQEAIGRPLDELLSPSPILELFDRVKAGQPQQAEIQLDGRGHFHVTLQLIPRVGKVAALHDITHFKELDAMKSEFVATVSHDLKNPLGTILGYAWLLDEEPDLSQDQRQYVISILESVNRMQDLVGNLLDLAKIEAGIDAERELWSLPAIIAEVTSRFDDQVEAKQIRLEIIIPDDLPPIMANKLRITQAISNLVSNAVKYTPETGRIFIEAKQTANSVLVGVIDNGPGISPEDQAKLFQKFSRVGGIKMRSVAGTGLGLAIVRSVVESHNGRVWVESQEGTGSAFFMQLPLGKTK